MYLYLGGNTRFVSKLCQESNPMPRHKRFNPVVKPRLNATGKITSWFVDAGMIDGRRVRFGFATKARAQAKTDEMKIAHLRHCDSILMILSPITPDVAAALELALSLTRRPWSKRHDLRQK